MNACDIRAAVTNDGTAVTACVIAAFAPYIERIGKPPAPMLADYPSLIAAGRHPKIGYVEYDRRHDAGYDRVFYRKQLAK